MGERILSISGLRGVVGDGLDPEYVVRFAAALGTWLKGGHVVLSRDGRTTGEMLRHAAIAGLTAAGCRVTDLGIATTPTCGVAVQQLGAAGGLQITASHNPIEWNGLKPFSARGSVLNATQGKELLEILEKRGPTYRSWETVGSVVEDPSAAMFHLSRVNALIDLPVVQARKFKVVLDCTHGSGSILSPDWLRSLGCEVVVLGGVADGRFEHPAEPLRENLTSLMDAVRVYQADVGFAQDPDADRLAIVDETGHYIGEELTLALCVDHVLSRAKGTVVVNGSTSRTTADIAARYGCEFVRSAVGEANVVARMIEIRALIGGEGNGGVIEPKVGYVRDSLVSMAYVLHALALKKCRLSEWVSTLPSYTIVKDKITCGRESVQPACDRLKEIFSDASIVEGDGLRLDWPDRWVQVRASNTEPIIRMIAEAPEAADAQQLVDRAKSVVAQIVNC
jgi:phosphomannomutase